MSQTFENTKFASSQGQPFKGPKARRVDKLILLGSLRESLSWEDQREDERKDSQSRGEKAAAVPSFRAH